MKRLSIMMMALALVLGMAQCKKELKQITPGGGEGVYVSAKAGHDDGAKTEITQVGANGLVQWSAGDKLYLVGAEQGYIGCLTIVNYSDANPSNWAEFGGNIIEITEAQNVHFYYLGKNKDNDDFTYNRTSCTYNYDITTQDGTLDGIENTMHLMHGMCENVAAGTTRFNNVTMHNMMAIAKFDISGYYGDAKCAGLFTTATLDLKNATWSNKQNATPVTFTATSDECYMALIPGDGQTLTFSRTDGSDPMVLQSHNIGAGTLNSDHGASVVVKQGIPGYLSGDFSVAAGVKVKFSKGNLQYQASTSTWRFAANQYDYVGNATYGTVYEGGEKCDNANISSSYTGWIDLFGWGTSGQEHGATCYQPWESDGDNSKYYAYGVATKNLDDDSGKADWGYNAISNGGNIVNSGWRTLKKDEWKYLLDERPVNGGTGEKYSYKRTTLTLADGTTTVYGLLVAPDNFTGSLNSSTSWNDWHNTLEPAGVVFLPAAGLRRINNGVFELNNIGEHGLYWSGKYDTNTNANNLWFSPGDVAPGDSDSRHYGHSVRLVLNVPSSK